MVKLDDLMFNTAEKFMLKIMLINLRIGINNIILIVENKEMVL
jgi:hypothetical protein